MKNIKQLWNKKHKYLIGLWRSIVMAKNSGNCVTCDALATEAHHIFSRGSSSFMAEYDPDNGIPLCTEHHQALHQNRDDDVELSIHDYLEQFNISYNDLQQRSKLSQKRSIDNLEIVEQILLEKSVVKRLITAGRFEFEFDTERRYCKKDCGAKERTIECQASCKHCDIIPFIVRKDGVEFGRLPSYELEGKIGSEKFMYSGILRFFTKYGTLLKRLEITDGGAK